MSPPWPGTYSYCHQQSLGLVRHLELRMEAPSQVLHPSGSTLGSWGPSPLRNHTLAGTLTLGTKVCLVFLSVSSSLPAVLPTLPPGYPPGPTLQQGVWACQRARGSSFSLHWEFEVTVAVLGWLPRTGTSWEEARQASVFHVLMATFSSCGQTLGTLEARHLDKHLLSLNLASVPGLLCDKSLLQSQLWGISATLRDR